MCCTGAGNWCRQDPKWLFSCLTEDKREKNIYKQDSVITGQQSGEGREEESKASKGGEEKDKSERRAEGVEVNEMKKCSVGGGGVVS